MIEISRTQLVDEVERHFQLPYSSSIGRIKRSPSSREEPLVAYVKRSCVSSAHLIYTLGNDHLFLCNLYVTPTNRQTGEGNRILARCMQVGDNLGLALELSVEEHSFMQQWYCQKGFRISSKERVGPYLMMRREPVFP